VKNALARGDRLTAANFATCLTNLVYLNEGDPDRARHEIVDFPQTRRRHYVRDWFNLLAKTHIDLYTGQGVRGVERVRAQWRRLKLSGAWRAPMVQIEATFLHARAALMAASQTRKGEHRHHLRRARRQLHKLRRGPRWAGGLAALVEAGVCAQRGNEEEAAGCLRRAKKLLDEQGLKLFSAVADSWLGHLLGGDEGRMLEHSAQLFMKQQTIRQPAHFAALLAPGIAPPP
jgi:hypothetical protein